MKVLSKRATQLSASDSNSSLDVSQAGEALTLAHDAFRWDRARATEVLRQTCANSLKVVARLGVNANAEQTMAGPFGRAIADRVACGDAFASADYESLIPYVERNAGFRTQFLSPLWSAPQDSGILRVGKRLMELMLQRLNPAQPDISFQTARSIAEESCFDPILVFRPYRDLLIAGLRDNRVLGYGIVKNLGPNMGFDYQFYQGPHGSMRLTGTSATGSKDGQRIRCTVGDAIALGLVTGWLKGWPEFSIALPEVDRKKQMDRLIAFLGNDKFDWLGFSKTSPFARLD